MTRAPVLRYLSHPQVEIDPDVTVPDWGLSDVGAERVANLCSDIKTGPLRNTTSVFSSPERKALETARPLAKVLGCPCTIIDNSGENDRSATGYLPGPEFEMLADAFFGHPETSTRGWEKAIDAQARILGCIRHILDIAPRGDILVVGHGAVGTLLYCARAGVPISRSWDQGPGGGGNFIAYDRATGTPHSHWQHMESLLGDSTSTQVC